MLGVKLLITVIYRRLSWRIGEIESSGDSTVPQFQIKGYVEQFDRDPFLANFYL